MPPSIRDLGQPTGGTGDAPWRVVMMTRGVRYVLPPRRVPHQRPIGLGIVGVCLAILAIVVLISRGLWWASLTGLVGGGAPTPGLAMLLIPAVAALLMARGVRFGVLVAFGHSEIEVSARRVAGVHRFGPIRRRRSVRADTIERVIVEPGLGDRAGKPEDAPGRGLANLVVERVHADEDERKMALTHAYPRATIDALAAAIGKRLSLPVAVEEPQSLRERHDRPRAGEDPGARRVPRPRRATGELVETAEGISVTLPPMGFFRGSKGLGSFSLLWLGFVTIFSTFWGVSMAGKGASAVDIFPLLIVGVFWLVGFGMFYGAARSGRRRGLIDVAGRDLVITRQSIGKPRVDGWNAAEIDRVTAGPSGTEINDKPVLELQVHLTGGGKRGFFPERRDDELRWLAGEIGHALGLGADRSDPE